MALDLDHALMLVRDERLHQMTHWGDSHDDEHTEYEWLGMITQHAGLALHRGTYEPTDNLASELWKRQMVRVAALAIAAAQAADRAPRREHPPDLVELNVNALIDELRECIANNSALPIERVVPVQLALMAYRDSAVNRGIH